jgi:DHA2 family multidrug resistance protein
MSPTAALPAARSRRVMITGTVMLASILQALDNTIANVALPRMQGSLSATQDQMSWVLTSYIVAAAIMTPLTGWLADRYGRKPLFLVSIIGFTLASALCGMAQSLEQIVLFRLLQGLAHRPLQLALGVLYQRAVRNTGGARGARLLPGHPACPQGL